MVPLSRWVLSGLMFTLLLAGCSTPQMRVDPGLAAQTPALPVSGREGWLVEQVLSFGEFRTDPVNRGWTKGYDYPFIIRFTGAREKLRFAVRDGSGREAVVHCAAKLREQDLRLFREYFDVNFGTTDTFIGTIALEGSRQRDFFIENLNTQQNIGYRPLEGAVRGTGDPIDIRAVWHLASGQRSYDTQPMGIEFLSAGRVVGAVETVNEGRVWISDDLGGEDRLLLASLASALLLRSSLADHNDGS